MAMDPKVHPADGRWPVYVPPNEDVERIKKQLRGQMRASDFGSVDIQPLPQDPKQIRQHGLLYLPEPYVVPGGRFN
jgi:alpha,alpha-trehalase